jgi:glucose/arabinose dehydrogenase
MRKVIVRIVEFAHGTINRMPIRKPFPKGLERIICARGDVHRGATLTAIFIGALGCAACLLPAARFAFDDSHVKNILTGKAAFDSYLTEKPGEFRKITVADLPAPNPDEAVANPPTVVPRPENAWPEAPGGFRVQLYATGLPAPREIRTAPNGDLFVAESYAGQVEVFRGITADGKPEQRSVFATGLHNHFGIAFYPPGDHPQWVYIANTGSVVRFPYQNGDLKARGPAETVIANIPAGPGHWTRDLAFSPDGKHLFVSVGSHSNVDDPDTHPAEFHRADILEFTPTGKFEKVYAYGIRNPVGIAVNPETGELWCSVNERDNLGNNLVPDYITHVTEDGFYGWPWFYIGGHWDPRLEGKHPELKDKVITPDVLLQAHNASLEMVFYEGNQFPSEYKGDIFAAEHGSWNKQPRAGYEVIRVPVDHGRAPGEYEDFLTGFVTQDGKVWGRPVGVAVASDGSLMVTDDGSKSIWRVTYTGK